MSASSPGNEELSKLLKKLGYPDIQEATKPSLLLTTAIAALTKRMSKVDELMYSIWPTVPKPLREAKETEDQPLDLNTRTSSYDGLQSHFKL